MPAARRSEPRFLCSELVKLRWRGRSRREREHTVILENISPSGACVQGELAIATNEPVTIVCRDHLFRGRVRSCRARDSAYFIGIEFNADSKWSIDQYTPEHLLDPREVKRTRSRARRSGFGAGGFVN